MGRKLALLIANSVYDDTNLSRLVTPEADVDALAKVLHEPDIGGFDEIDTLKNETTRTIMVAIARFFAKKKRDELLLLYFSGHGILDNRGDLYLAARDTDHELINATAIPSSFINDRMVESSSKQKVLILDCCYSGAFTRGTKGQAGKAVNTSNRFNGRGQVVMTATDATEYAWEGDAVIGEAQSSVFTRHLVQGLETGEADSDNDGWITLDEWYNYVYEQVTKETSRQTPGKWMNQQGWIPPIAKSRIPFLPGLSGFQQVGKLSSIWSDDIQLILDQAGSQVLKKIQVGNQIITFPSPFPSPEDWRDTWLYYLLVDRFNNPEISPRHLPWNNEYSDFQGGTFDGIRQQLDYLQSLGVGALWLSPVLKNCQYLPSYHGSAIQDFLNIEPRLASDLIQAQQDPYLVESELRQVVDEAHARGMYVVLDIVLHIVGDVFAYKDYGSVAPWSEQPYTIYWRDEQGNDQQDWTEPPLDPPANTLVWPRELQRNTFFRRQGNAFSSLGELHRSGDFYSLKGLVTDLDAMENPLQSILIRAYQFLIARYDIDGFRIDAFKYISPDFVRAFAASIREFALGIGKRNFFIFSEVYSNEEDMARFSGRNTADSTVGGVVGVDAVLDYPLFYKLASVCKGLLAPNEVVTLFEHRMHVWQSIYSTQVDASKSFVTFLDNQSQTARFSLFVNRHEFDDQVILGVGCLFALPGIPSLYYGTEQGLSGTGNTVEAVREAFWGKPNAFDQNSVLYRAIQQLTALRKNQPALRYGRCYFRPLSGDGIHFSISTTAPGVLAFSRMLNDREIVVVANTSTQQGWIGQVLIDSGRNFVGSAYSILFSNKTTASSPVPIVRLSNSVEITETDGTITRGPITVLPVDLRPMEIQILAK